MAEQQNRNTKQLWRSAYNCPACKQRAYRALHTTKIFSARIVKKNRSHTSLRSQAHIWFLSYPPTILNMLAKSSQLEDDYLNNHPTLPPSQPIIALGSRSQTQLFTVQPSWKFDVVDKYRFIYFEVAKIHILISKNNDYEAVTDSMFGIIYCFVAILICRRLLLTLHFLWIMYISWRDINAHTTFYCDRIIISYCFAPGKYHQLPYHTLLWKHERPPM